MSSMRKDDDPGGQTAIAYLEAQHREAEALFEALETANDHDEKQDLFDTLADKLAIHTRVEESYFYPAVRERKTEDLVIEAFIEHTSVKQLLGDLMMTDVDSISFDIQLAALKEQVARHVEEEENELFPAAKELLSRDELLAVAEDMAALAANLEGTDPRKQLPGELSEQPSLG
jgi:hemerythrin superfamily protein